VTARKAHFRVNGRLDMASRLQAGTLTIDLGSRTVRIRPYKRRKLYELPLDFVAEWICRLAVIEAANKRAERKAERRARRG
jgi:hypothetical protein